MHLLALHQDASNNPEGIASTSDRIRFHPYYSAPSNYYFLFYLTKIDAKFIPLCIKASYLLSCGQHDKEQSMYEKGYARITSS